MSKNDQNHLELAKQHANEAAKRLFGKRTPEVEEALKKVTTIGNPKNLIGSDSDEDEEHPASRKE